MHMRYIIALLLVHTSVIYLSFKNIVAMGKSIKISQIWCGLSRAATHWHSRKGGEEKEIEKKLEASSPSLLWHSTTNATQFSLLIDGLISALSFE